MAVDFLPFADSPSANVIDQATWAAGALSQGQSRSIGFLGDSFAEAQEANKVWRQSSLIGAMIANFIDSATGLGAFDTDTVAALLAKFQSAVTASAGRRKIPTSGYGIYVTTGGSDASDGSSSAPFKTLQRAWNHIVRDIDLDGNVVTVTIGPGTYGPFTAFGQVLGAVGPQSVNFIGDLVTPTNVVIAAFNACAVFAANTQFTIKGVAIEASGSDPITGIGIVGIYGSTVLYFDRITFGACSTAHWGAVEGAFVGGSTSGGSYTISGSAGAHVYAVFGGQAQIDSNTIQVLGTPTFANGFANSSGDACIRSFGCVFSGPALGPRYQVGYGSQIMTQGAGASYFPGSAAGTADGATGGYYT